MAYETVNGYCWPQSVAPGERVALHLSSSGGRPVSVELARVGATRDVVFSEGGVPAGDHPTPTDAPEQGCGWPVTAEIVAAFTLLTSRSTAPLRSRSARPSPTGAGPAGNGVAQIGEQGLGLGPLEMAVQLGGERGSCCRLDHCDSRVQRLLMPGQGLFAAELVGAQQVPGGSGRQEPFGHDHLPGVVRRPHVGKERDPREEPDEQGADNQRQREPPAAPADRRCRRLGEIRRIDLTGVTNPRPSAPELPGSRCPW